MVSICLPLTGVTLIPILLDTDHSEIPQEHKCAHILELDNGNFAAQPNNRLLWNINSFTTRNEIPDYKVQTNDWNVENKDWRTEDTDKFFYEIEEKKLGVASMVGRLTGSRGDGGQNFFVYIVS